MKEPIKLGKPPLLEAIIEIRVEQALSVPVVYNLLASIFDGGIEELPIMQLPQMIRESDPNIKYQATHRLRSSNGLVLNIGPYVFACSRSVEHIETTNYSGWNAFYEEFKQVYQMLKANKLTNNASKAAVRYVNLFQQDDLLNLLKFKLVLPNEDLGKLSDTNINFVLEHEDCVTRVTIATGATIQLPGGPIKGQIIDIDSQKDLNASTVLMLVKTLHTRTKRTFFACLSDELLNQLDPVYES